MLKECEECLCSDLTVDILCLVDLPYFQFPFSVLPSSSDGAAISIHSEIFSFFSFLSDLPQYILDYFFSLQTSSFRQLSILNDVSYDWCIGNIT